MKVVCIDDSNSEILVQGREYFIFPEGSVACYVSKFNNRNAHFGCYSAARFKPVVSDEADIIIESPVEKIQSESIHGQIEQLTLF